MRSKNVSHSILNSSPVDVGLGQRQGIARRRLLSHVRREPFLVEALQLIGIPPMPLEKSFLANRQGKILCVYVSEETSPDEDQRNERKFDHLEVHS